MWYASSMLKNWTLLDTCICAVGFLVGFLFGVGVGLVFILGLVLGCLCGSQHA